LILINIMFINVKIPAFKVIFVIFMLILYYFIIIIQFKIKFSNLTNLLVTLFVRSVHYQIVYGA